MGQNIIELGFNVEELTEQKQQVLALFVDLFGKLKEYDGTQFNPLGTGGLADLKKSITDGAKAMDAFGQSAAKYNEVVTNQAQAQQQSKKSVDELTLATKAYKNIVDQTATTQAKANSLGSNAAENLAIEKEQLKQRNTELQKSVQYLLAQNGSVNEAKAANAQLIIERDKLNAADETSAARIKEINDLLNRNNDFIKANTSLQEQQKANVGNYTGALQVLEASLNEVNAKLEQLTSAGQQGGEAYANLAKESGLLNVLVGQQQRGFASVTQEIRNSERALQTLSAEGFAAGEAFNNLRATTVEAAQAQKEFQRQQKLLEGEAPLLGAITVAAKGLAGAYAIGQGAASLFADGNEKIAKDLNKLVAIMTILQGLNEAYHLIQEAGAISTAIQTAATKAAVVVQTAFAGSATAAAEANTTLAASEVGVVAGAEAETAALGEMAVVAEGTSVALAETAEAAVAVNTALLATGIGATVAAVAAAIIYLIAKIPDWIKGNDISIKQQGEIADAVKNANEALIQQATFYGELDQGMKRYYQNQLALSQAAGNNEEKNFATRKALTAEEKNLAQQTIDQLGATNEQQSNLSATIQDLNNKRQESIDIQLKLLAIPEQNRTSGQNRDLDAAKANEEYYSKALAGSQALFEAGRKAREDLFSANQKQAEEEAKMEKFYADEQRKVILETTSLEVDYIKSKNSLILNDDRSTLTQRLAAIRSNADQEKRLAEAQKDNVLDDPGASFGDKDIAIQKAAESEKKITASTQEEIYKLRISYADRQRDALTAIRNNQLGADAAEQEAISKNAQKELDDRLEGLKKSIDDKTAIIINDYNKELALAKEHGKTQAEIDELASNKQKALVALTADTQKQIYDITVSYGEKKLKDVEELNKVGGSSDQYQDTYNKQIDDLNKSLTDQTISYTHYINAKKRLDNQYAIDKDRADIADDEAALKRLKDSEDQTIRIKLESAQKRLAAAVLGGDGDQIGKAQAEVDGLLEIQRKAAGDQTALEAKTHKDKLKLHADSVALTLAADKFLADQEKKLAEASFNLAQQLVDASYENKINAIQKEIDKTDEQSQAEIAAIQRSTLTQQQQTEEIIILTAQQKATDTGLKKQQRDEKIKEAKFDRDVAVAKALWAGAEAEIAAIGEYGGTPAGFAIAAVIAALTAVQVATILAKPIPTYAEGIGIPGKGQHPGGDAWVGEAYRPERVTMPGKKPFIVDSPTLLNLPARSIVEPLMDNLVFDVGGVAMAYGMSQINNGPENNRQAWEIAKWQSARMERAIKKSQRRIVNQININVDPTWQHYVNKKVLGKA